MGKQGNQEPWYRQLPALGAIVVWMPLIPDGERRRGIYIGPVVVRSGDPRATRTVLEVLPFGGTVPERIETWQAHAESMPGE